MNTISPKTTQRRGASGTAIPKPPARSRSRSARIEAAYIAEARAQLNQQAVLLRRAR